MNKAEKYIQDYTRNCSNEYLTDSKSDGLGGYISRRKFTPWLTPDQALKAVEIAREEIYEWLSNNVFEDKYLDLRKMGIEHAFYGYNVDTLISDLKQAMKDE